MVQTPSRPATAAATTVDHDHLPIQGIDYLEFYVGNAKQAAHFYRTGFGFRLTAYCGPETKVRDHASYVVQQGDIRFVFTSPLTPESEIAKHIMLHGDGVKDIALRVDDAAAAFEATVAGARNRSRSQRGSRAKRAPAEGLDQGVRGHDSHLHQSV